MISWHVFYIFKRVELINEKYFVEHYLIWDDGIFPNSRLNVLVYKHVFNLPFFFPANAIKKLFKKNGWYNAWKDGIYTYRHYHSVTHEVLGIYRGETKLELGGETGVIVKVKQGDVILIPAGVSHRNLGEKDEILCVGAYPGGIEYDMNCGKLEERAIAYENIKKVPIPSLDPVFGLKGELQHYWKGVKK